MVGGWWEVSDFRTLTCPIVLNTTLNCSCRDINLNHCLTSVLKIHPVFNLSRHFCPFLCFTKKLFSNIHQLIFVIFISKNLELSLFVFYHNNVYGHDSGKIYFFELYLLKSASIEKTN